MAVREAINHAVSALGAAIARVGTKAREGNGLQSAKFVRRRMDQQADLPVAGMIAQRDGTPIGRAKSALRAENQKVFASDFSRIPSHASILRKPKKIAAWAVPEQFLCQRQTAGRPASAGLHLIHLVRRIKDIIAGTHGSIETRSFANSIEKVSY